MVVSATATRGLHSIHYRCRWREGSRAQIPASRSACRGVRASAQSATPIPLAGAPTSIGTSLRGLIFLVPSRGVAAKAACDVHLPHKAAGGVVVALLVQVVSDFMRALGGGNAA